MKECGLTECELWAPQIEPPSPLGRGRPPGAGAASARGLRTWRLETPLDHFRAIQKKFDAAGITIYAYNYSPNTSFTDAEIDRGFEMAKALGAEIITASTTLDVATRIAPFAEQAPDGRSRCTATRTSTDPNEFATPESFAAAMKMSQLLQDQPRHRPLHGGQLRRRGLHPRAPRRHHQPAPQGSQEEPGRQHRLGQGDTPIREVLQLLKQESWPIRAYIEYEHRGEAGPVDEVKKCFAFAKSALA